MASPLNLELSPGQNTPSVLYGTAWKEEKTSELTEAAIKRGFRGIDTANHPTGYNEPLTGDGIASAIASGVVERKDLFIQSKFAPVFTHYPEKVPFNTEQDVAAQARESIDQTLKNLKVDYLDSLVLLAPYPDIKDSLAVWKVFESYVPGKIRHIGVSNITKVSQLQAIYETATVKPAVVQNRFYQDSHFDTELRAFCNDHGIVYQAFWMLKHNAALLGSDVVGSVARSLGIEKELAMYRLILELGNTQVLDGTTQEGRMISDIEAIRELAKDSSARQTVQEYGVVFKRLLWKLACEYDGPPPTLSADR